MMFFTIYTKLFGLLLFILSVCISNKIMWQNDVVWKLCRPLSILFSRIHFHCAQHMASSLSRQFSTASRDTISTHGSTTVFNHHSPPLFLRVQYPTSCGSGGAQFSKFKCSAADSQTGFFTKLGRLIKEKAKKDVEKIFSGGFSKTRDNLAVIDELLLYWNLSDTDRVLDELEEVNSITLRTFCFCK